MVRFLRITTMAAAIFLAACSRPGNQTTTAPATSATSPGPRIISTVPAATLNLVLLGAADRLVGVTRYDDIILPDAQKNLPVVGDYETMDYERLITLHPTALIIQTSEARLSPRLRDLAASHNIQLVNIKLDTLDDLWTTIDQLGQISGKQLAAKRAVATAKSDLVALQSQTQSLPHPRTLYALSQNPVMIVGDHTFVDQMLTIAGADNVGKTIGNAYPIVGLETLVKLAPDVLLISAPGEPAQTPDDPRLTKWLQLPIPAARHHKIFLITDPNSLMASTQVADNTRDLAQLLHPDALNSADNQSRDREGALVGDNQSRDRKGAVVDRSRDRKGAVVDRSRDRKGAMGGAGPIAHPPSPATQPTPSPTPPGAP